MESDKIPFCCLPLQYLLLKHTTNDSKDIPPHLFEFCDLQYYHIDHKNHTGIADQKNHGDVSYATYQRDAWFEIILRIICLFGIVANILNLIVLASRRITSRLDNVGKSVNHGLMALAVSDLLFCVVVLPHSFVTTDDILEFLPKSQVFVFYYKIYGIALINVFQMTSIWLVVIMAVARYFGVSDPLHARNRFWTRHMFMLIASVYIFAFIVTLPLFLSQTVLPCKLNDDIFYHKSTSFQSRRVNRFFNVYIRWIWPIIASFIPIIILLICNARLLRELNRLPTARRSLRVGTEPRPVNRVVTVTLVSIVVMSLLLVAPPEILRYVDPYQEWGQTGRVIANIANLLQTLNFAVNFVLYCIVNTHFRKIIKSSLLALVGCIKQDQQASPTSSVLKGRTFTQKTSLTCRLSDRTDDEQDMYTSILTTSRSKSYTCNGFE